MRPHLPFMMPQSDGMDRTTSLMCLQGPGLMYLSVYTGAVADLVASLLQPEGVSPERQAAFTDCVGDALRNSSSVGATAVALQALQGFIDGNG